MVQLNLIEMNNVFVSTGDPERDLLVKLTKTGVDDMFRTLAEIMQANLEIDYGFYWHGEQHQRYYYGYDNTRLISLSGARCKVGRTIGYFDRFCQLWISNISYTRNWNDTKRDYEISGIHIDEFKKTDKYVHNIVVLNPVQDQINKLKEFYPYAYKLWADQYQKNQYEEWGHKRYKVYDGEMGLGMFLMAPQFEQLIKAGFAFADNMITRSKYLRENEIDCFNRLCKRGNNLKEIFKTPKVVYETLKDEKSLDYWDTIRRMFKNGTISQDTIEQIVDAHFDKQDMEKISFILRQEYNGKKVFTFNSLMNYLRRIDMYEAIDSREGFMYLRDYLNMCKQLEMEPKLDGDSLKREHDVTARMIRDKHDEIMEKKLNDSCGYLAELNYEEGDYLIRGIQGYKDLVDEAKQQHNCVASYANSIASRKSLIYVLRKKEKPDVSLVTVELAPNRKEIRQKFLAYNQPIRNKSISDFLDNWLEFIKKKEEIA